MKVSQDIGTKAFIEAMNQLKDRLIEEDKGIPSHEYYNALLGIGMNFMGNLLTRMKDIYKNQSYTYLINLFATGMKFSLEIEPNDKLH